MDNQSTYETEGRKDAKEIAKMIADKFIDGFIKHLENEPYIFEKDNYPPLTRDLNFTLTYIKNGDFWLAENDDIGIRAAGISVKDLVDEILILLDFMVDVYIVQDQKENLNPKLQKEVDYLKDIIDLEKCDKPHWEDD